MAEITVTTEEEFENLPWEGDTLVLFTAPDWCMPCRRLEPHWNKVQEQLKDITFVKIDMGASPEDTGAHWASSRFGIRGVPQVKLWIEGSAEPVDVQARAVVPLIREITSHD